MGGYAYSCKMIVRGNQRLVNFLPKVLSDKGFAESVLHWGGGRGQRDCCEIQKIPVKAGSVVELELGGTNQELARRIGLEKAFGD